MVSRNGDSISFALGIIGGVISFISLILTCVGIGLPTWYVGLNANNTITIATANLFYSCYSPNASQGIISSKLSCVPYSTFSCSTTSYQNSILNLTSYNSGCTNPNSDASSYLSLDAPIYQLPIDVYFRLRSASILSIISILFIFFSTIFGFLTGFIILNIYVVFIAPILATIAVIFGISGLVTAGAAFNYTGAGFALFTVGVILESIVATILSILAGRLNEMKTRKGFAEDESTFIHRGDAPMIIRRVQKRRV